MVVRGNDVTQIEWHNDTTPIAEADILAKQKELQTAYDNNAYQRSRAVAYPPIFRFDRHSWIMAYIGRSPSVGVRSRFQYQASAGQTSFSGSDANSLVLSYNDTLYMDVYQNGILLVPGDDYTATTGTTMVLVQAASLNDIVEMVVYDVFSVANSFTKTESDTRYPFLGNEW